MLARSRLRARRGPMVLCLVLAFALGMAESASADHTYKLWHFNACGAVIPSADNPLDDDCNSGEVYPLTSHIRGSIETFKPHAVSLNEICERQFQSIHWELNSGTHWHVDGRFVPTKETSNCRKPDDTRGGRYGNGIFVSEPIFGAEPQVVDLPYAEASGETRRIACLVTAFAKGTVVCTVHITARVPKEGSSLPKNYYKNAQITKVASVVNAHVDAGHPVVLMGDFNVEPHDNALDRIYESGYGGGAYGRFREVDETHGTTTRTRDGENTTDSNTRKIDYIFVSRRDWTALSGDAISSMYSDHHHLRGWARLIHP